MTENNNFIALEQLMQENSEVLKRLKEKEDEYYQKFAETLIQK